MSKKPLIVFEGVEGSGKSYHIKSVSNYLKKKKIGHILIREPGGTKISEKSSIGLNMKIIQQNLIDIGTGAEAGKGKSTDFSFDIVLTTIDYIRYRSDDT